tara:strand:- start:1597 stop:2022 length:426 start_codon:yes stop_codon:yes gene_type:complete
MKIDKKLIKELTEYLNEFGLTELEYGDNETKVKVSKSKSLSSSFITKETNSSTSSVDKKEESSSGTKINSPIIGTAYLSPEPGAKKFIEIGKKIKKGDTLMIVEAMKTMNHVPSTVDGIVKEICVDDGSPVEFGQTIVILE